MLKTLSQSLYGHKKDSLATIIFSIIEVVFEIAIPLCMADLIDYNGITLETIDGFSTVSVPSIALAERIQQGHGGDGAGGLRKRL